MWRSQSGKCCRSPLIEFRIQGLIFPVNPAVFFFFSCISISSLCCCVTNFTPDSFSVPPQGQLSVSCCCLKLSNQKRPMASSWLSETDMTVDGTESLSWHKSVFCSYPGNIWLLTCNWSQSHFYRFQTNPLRPALFLSSHDAKSLCSSKLCRSRWQLIDK